MWMGITTEEYFNSTKGIIYLSVSKLVKRYYSIFKLILLFHTAILYTKNLGFAESIEVRARILINNK